MDEVLSQDEINALLAAMADEDADAPATALSAERDAGGAAEDRIQPYNFSRPNKLSKDQLRVLELMHEPFARGVGLTLSAYLRTLVEANMVSAELLTYEELTRQLFNPGIVSIFSLAPLQGNVLLEIHPDLGFAIIDRLLGGIGQTPKQLRELTDIEQPVMTRVVERIMANLVEAWQHLTPVEPRFERAEFHPQFSQIAAPKDMVVVINIEISLRGIVGQAKLVIPFDMIEPLVPKLSSHHLFVYGQRDASYSHEEALRSKLYELEVPLTVVLGSADVGVSDLLDLSVGDYISLETKAKEPLPIRVGNLEKFMGRPGRTGTRMAVEVVAVIPSEQKR